MEDQAGKQNVWGEINCRDSVINRKGIMEDHPKDTHINKVSSRQNGGDSFHTADRTLIITAGHFSEVLLYECAQHGEQARTLHVVAVSRYDGGHGNLVERLHN